MREQAKSLVIGLLSVATVLIVWELAGRYGRLNPVLVPRPSLIAATLWEIIRSGDLVEPLAHTIGLFFIGYTAATVIGVLLGLAMGTSPVIFGALEPTVELLRPIPKPALVPVLFLFLGIGEKAEIAIIVLAAVFPILINTLAGVRGVDSVLIETARTFRLTRTRTVFAVILPAAMPLILAGMRIALGLALVLTILSEMLAGDKALASSSSICSAPSRYATCTPGSSSSRSWGAG